MILESIEVDLPALQDELVAGRARHQDRSPLVAERLAEPRDVDVDQMVGGVRRILRPQLVDQPLGGDELVRPQGEGREQRSLLASTQGERFAVEVHLERSEDQEFERHAVGSEGRAAR